MSVRVSYAMRQTADVAAYGGTIATLLGWLPHIAAVLSIIWLSLQIVEKLSGATISELIKRLYKFVTRK